MILPDGELLVRRGPRSRSAAGLPHRSPPNRDRAAAGEDHPVATSPPQPRFLLDQWLLDVTASFAGKMTLIAIALTIIERVLLPERPAYFVTAGRRGGGKTTAIMMAVAAVRTGRRPPAAAWSLSEEERSAKRCSRISARRSMCWCGTTSRAVWRFRALRSKSR